MERVNGNRQILKPIIEKVIDGFILKFKKDEMDISIFNAGQVKEGCYKINPEINWNTRIPAICNCMRNYIREGKGEVISQDTDTNDFTILYNNSMNNNKSDISKCLKNLIINFKGKLQPTIFKVIVELIDKNLPNQGGVIELNAEQIKNECSKIRKEIDWNGRIPAICNSMRKLSSNCGAKILSEDRDFNGFTISITKF